MSPLHDSDIQALLAKYSIKPTKERGQSFLTSQKITNKILASAALRPEDKVLEIGGGFGILSKPIADQVDHLYVIEIDKGLYHALTDHFQGYTNVTLIHDNALHVDLPAVNKVISNLPYNVASEITFRLLHEWQFESAILMFQKEFAQRLLAKSGTSEYSRLSIDFQYLGIAEHILDVKAKEFYPRPKVESSVLRVNKRREGPFAKNDTIFFWMVHGIYSYPNKQLKKALKIWFKLLGVSDVSNDMITTVPESIEITKRLRSLTLGELVQLADILLGHIEKGRLPDPRGVKRG